MKPGILFAAAFALAASAAQAADVMVMHPWARATPAGAQVGAAYATIENKGAAADRLVSATADIADHVEIHEMSMADGVMKMRQLTGGLELPAGKAVELKPGGYHLMLIGLKHPLKVGETIKGTLTFEKAGAMPVELKVEPIGAGAGDMKMDMHKH